MLPVRYKRRPRGGKRTVLRRPGAIGDSVSRAVDLIRANPAIGARATNVKLRGVRRVHLSRVRYHLYYRVRSDHDEIEVLAFWHTSRGSAPPL